MLSLTLLHSPQPPIGRENRDSIRMAGFWANQYRSADPNSHVESLWCPVEKPSFTSAANFP